MRLAGAIAAVVVMIGCTSPPQVGGSSPGPPSQPSGSPVVAASPSYYPTPSADASPTPLVFPSPSPPPIGTPVARSVLAPAADLPIAALCSYAAYTTADGNFRPLFCRGGALNVVAWKAYVQIGSNVMSVGRGATLLEVETAICRDDKFLHATKQESEYAYEISAAYHGWTFEAEVSKWMYEPYNPNHPLC